METAKQPGRRSVIRLGAGFSCIMLVLCSLALASPQLPLLIGLVHEHESIVNDQHQIVQAHIIHCHGCHGGHCHAAHAHTHSHPLVTQSAETEPGCYVARLWGAEDCTDVDGDASFAIQANVPALQTDAATIQHPYPAGELRHVSQTIELKAPQACRGPPGHDWIPAAHAKRTTLAVLAHIRLLI